jgi:hypothetical protein
VAAFFDSLQFKDDKVSFAIKAKKINSTLAIFPIGPVPIS